MYVIQVGVVHATSNQKKVWRKSVKSIALGGHSFSIACSSEIVGRQNGGFPLNSREVVQIIGGQNVGSMHVKRSDPEKD